jgi:hypothetical protein
VGKKNIVEKFESVKISAPVNNRNIGNLEKARNKNKSSKR